MESSFSYFRPLMLRQSGHNLSIWFPCWFHDKTMQPIYFSHNMYTRNFHMPSLTLALALLVSLVSPISSCTEQEKSSLFQLLSGFSRDGGLTATWRSDTNCCTWEGITCSRDWKVTDISLPSRGLEGSISPFLGNLTGLLRLNLSGNSLSGGLPLELVQSSSILVLDVSFNRLTGGLNELPSSAAETPIKVLNISSNQFTGRFPSSAWEVMKSLVTLNASNNSFTGQIPTTYCLSAPSFAVLELSFNQFSGNIPQGLSNCTMLKLLTAGYNNLSGTLPEELFNVTSLEHLSLPSNRLQGAVDGISKLTNLVTLDLGGNDISGNIPESIGDLKRLEELHLDYNIMSGELPAALSNCTNLVTIDLRTNHFNGELTKVNFSNMSNLRKLDLLYNSFTGKIPESIYSCSRLIGLRLSSNKLDGQLSPRISDLKYLSFLSLANNSFTNITNALHILQSSKNLATLLIGNNFQGELMPEDDRIDGFDNLQVLDIQGCQLSGKIPLWISRLTNLDMLLLNSNQLTGPIPGWINSLSHLFFMDVSNNNLTGEIPLNLTEVPMLKSIGDGTQFDLVFQLPVYNGPSLQYRVVTSVPTVLNLSHNYFTGVIPQQIGQLKVLAVLDFSFNKLSGQIPKSIGNLTNLLLLDLSNNNLTGEIPGALNNLHFLGAFNVAYNDLEGPVPSGGQFNTFGTSSFDGNTKLCGPMLIHKCDAAEAPPASILSTKQIDYKVPFGIAFSAFFFVGVLYDQIVLSRYFGCIYFSRN